VLAAQSASTLLARDLTTAREQVERVQELAQDAVAELRAVVFQLRPAEIEAEGLAAALRKHVELVRRAHGADVELLLAGDPQRRPTIDEEVFRIAQEALQNAVRHAAASRIEVALDEFPTGLWLRISDDGVGFDPGAAELRARRLGLTSMEERARALGARLEIASAPGAGTRIGLEVSDERD
jgi:signal transduction histidine kinase